MHWIWQLSDWRTFPYDVDLFHQYEKEFLDVAGQSLGTLRHIEKGGQTEVQVELLRNEALQTSEIEGEYLDKESLQSSLQRQFGLRGVKENHLLREKGVSELLVKIYREFHTPMSHHFLQSLHSTLFQGQRNDAGQYRDSREAMQVVSGAIDNPTAHYEAPPSERVLEELDAFISWYNEAHQSGSIPCLALAAITHLWFETIHPFEDGNGRIGRALAEKSLSQSLGRPALISISSTIQKKKNAYYDALSKAQSGVEVDITEWMHYFQPLVLEAQQMSLQLIEFIIQKARYLRTYQPQINKRQEKVLLRMLSMGVEGFQGGLSAQNYRALTKAPTTTVTRDLNDLVQKGALTKSGERKHTRYWLNLSV